MADGGRVCVSAGLRECLGASERRDGYCESDCDWTCNRRRALAHDEAIQRAIPCELERRERRSKRNIRRKRPRVHAGARVRPRRVWDDEPVKVAREEAPRRLPPFRRGAVHAARSAHGHAMANGPGVTLCSSRPQGEARRGEARRGEVRKGEARLLLVGGAPSTAGAVPAAAVRSGGALQRSGPHGTAALVLTVLTVLTVLYLLMT
jgi:hypothetical protein